MKRHQGDQKRNSPNGLFGQAKSRVNEAQKLVYFAHGWHLALNETPLNVQYCRSRKHPEWTITVTRHWRWRTVKA